MSVVVLATVIFLMIGLVIDGGGKLQANDDARWIAQQAARTATQQVSVQLAAGGGSAGVNIAAAEQAAMDYLTASGATGTVTQTADGVHVTVTTIYHTKILPLLGMTELASTATATARMAWGTRG